MEVKKQLSYDDLKGLARDIVLGRVFTSIGLSESKMRTAFPVFSFLSKESAERLVNGNIVAVYEYYDKASPVGINGLPVFFSCNLLTKEQVEALMQFVAKLQRAMDEAI